MSGIINQVGAKSGIISHSSATSAGTVTLSGTTGLDYEEGTFTARLTCATPNFTESNFATANRDALGKYTRIGNLVTVGFNHSNADTRGGSGIILITGMPYIANERATGSILLYNMAFNSSAIQTSFISAGLSRIEIYEARDNDSWQSLTMTAGTGKYTIMGMTYQIQNP